MHALVFGCGYLGRRVARRWQNAGYSVTALTRSSERAAECHRLGITPRIGDICQPHTLRDLPPADVVLFAVGFDARGKETRESVMVDGLRNVLVALPGCEQFLAISSSSVYGQSAGEWVDETSPTLPLQPGGVCSVAAEQLVHDLAPQCAERWNILRLSGIYGPGRLLTRVEGLRSRQPLAGLADAWLNLIHVDDAALAVCECRDRGRSGSTYLVTDDQPVTRGTYYSRLAELAGAPPPVFDPNLSPARGSGGLNKRCSNRRLREELGVSLAFPTITAGLAHAWSLDGQEPGPRALPTG